MRHALTPEDLWRIPRVGEPAPGPDGSFVVVPVTAYDLEKNQGTTRLYRVADGRVDPLTAPDRSSTAPAVGPEGTRLAFLREIDELPQLHVMHLGGGEAEPLTNMPLGVVGLKWLPDGAGFIFLAPVFKEALDVEASRELAKARQEDPVEARVTEDRVFRYWDRWLTDGKVPHVFRLDLESGEIVDLTPDSQRWWNWETPGDDFDVSPDGREIVFSADTSEPPHDQPRFAIFTVPVEGGSVECLTPDGTSHERRPRYSPDGSLIVYGMQQEIDFYADRVRLVRYDRAAQEHLVLTEDWDRSAAGWEFTPQGTVIFVAEDHGRVNLYRAELEPGIPQLVAAGGTYAAPRPAGDRVFAQHQELSQPTEIVEIGPEVVPITTFTDAVMSELHLGDVEEVEFTGADGRPIQGYLVFPPNFDSESTWPLVHKIHGGPHGVFGDFFHFRWNAHAFAAPGYVVAMVNFHGSTSWGQDFTASIHGEWGNKPTEDILAATDQLIERGFIDPDRMAITGGSYGGYLTAWLTSQTDRFACAIAHAAVTNLGGMYASDLTQGRPLAYGAEYFDDHEQVDQWSPSAHAAGYSTPTLVIHGEKDYRVPVTQGLELYGVLKAKGIEARLVYYPDENHWILKPRNSIHWYGEVLSWLDRYLNPVLA
jgi:dipeptidyl aminopeptidase/acylaminoacyl peptidase